MKRSPSSLLVALVAPVVWLFVLPASGARAQELSLGAYGNVNFEAAHTVVAGGGGTVNEATFAIPNLDLFLRGSAGKWSFVAETLFDIDDGNTIVVDVDRMQVTYEHADWFKVTVGKFHTAYGYYNTAYPHGGTVYLLPIDRPALVDQHDGDSILPTTTVGINLRGRLAMGDNAFSYDLDVGNGRTAISDETANGEDLNLAKAYNLRLRYEISGLIIGANAAVDWIPPRLTAPMQLETLREQIFGGHVAYVEYPWHLIAEAFLVQHVAAAETFTTLAGLAEIGYSIETVTPYARLELGHFPEAIDPFWAATVQQLRGNYQAVSGGVKWMPNETIALKCELEVNHAQVDTIYSATTQVAFGF